MTQPDLSTSPSPALIPPSYEECMRVPHAPAADYVISPMAMAALIFDEDEDD